MNTKIIKQLFLVTAALVFTACSENLLEQTYSSSKGRSATVQLNISTAEEQGEALATKAIPPSSVTEGTVSDFWLLEYGADGNLLQADEKPVVEYFTKEDLVAMNNKLNIQLPNEGSNDSYKCVMIANTHNRSFFDRANPSLYDTLEKLKELTKDVTSINDTYNYDTKDLYLSCVTNVNKSTTKLECMFYRNVAKLTFSVENKVGSGMKITGIEVCNVPNKMAYADCLYDGGTDKMASGADLFNLEQETIEINEGDRHSFIYYLPRNCQGVDATGITDVKKKNKSDLHKSATCVKVYATENSTLNPYCYTFYLGENMTNDFNVRSNWHYTLPINISTPGDADSDSRVEDLDAVKLEANCIIVNDPKRVYSIQPYKRCNQYWNEIMKIYSGFSDKVLMTEDFEWKARILWNDISEQSPIVFCDRNGNDPTDVFNGKGKEKLYFKLRDNTQQYGNVQISVNRKIRQNFEQELWSWHLWLTNYNPNVAAAKKPWQDGVYKVNVDNGAVYRYASGVDIYPTFWSKYKNKYIMDRNLGATTNKEPSVSDDIKKSGGLFYQFGRKDPFVRNEIILYSKYKVSGVISERIDGNGKKDYIYISTTTNNRYYNSTFHPYHFYQGKEGSWTTTNPFPSDAKWDNPTWYKTESGKSFFDPCPEGWKIPDNNGCWNIVSKTGDVTDDNGSTSQINGTMRKGKGYNFPIDAIDGKITTFYPFTGYRDTDGTVTKESNYGAYWTTNPSQTDLINKGEGFRIQDTGNVDLRINFYRSIAASVRCVQE